MAGTVRLYFAFEGTEYRVHDTIFTNGKNKRLPLGDAHAKTRIFVPEAGVHRVYAFGKNESHAVTEADLARQLRESGYTGTSKFDPHTLTPDRPPRRRGE